MQSNYAIATVRSSSTIGVIATFCINLTIPCVRVTSDNGLLEGFGGVDSQVKSHYTIAAVRSGGAIGVIATLGINLAIPCIRVTSDNGLLEGLGGVDSQVESHYTIAAVRSSSTICVLATFGINLAIPCIRVTSLLIDICIYKLGSKYCGQHRVLSKNQCTWVVGISVRPLFKEVSLVGCSRNLCCFASRILLYFSRSHHTILSIYNERVF